jgi:nucleoside 2-deoxyribosyltransferase
MSTANYSFDFANAVVYLSGSIDFDEDAGIPWRRQISKRLVKLGFKKKNILSPTRKPANNLGNALNNEASALNELRAKEDWDGHCLLTGKVARVDLRMVDKSDLVIANFALDKNGKIIPTYGTMHEIIVAREQQKPVLLVWEGGKKTCSGWLMWLVGHKNVFENFDEVEVRLIDVASGKPQHDSKDWVVLDMDKDRKERKAKRQLVKFVDR